MALFSKSLNPGKSQFLITTEDCSCIGLCKWVYMAGMRDIVLTCNYLNFISLLKNDAPKSGNRLWAND